VGAGYSAANTLLNLAQLAEQAPRITVTWAIRAGSPARIYGRESADALPARGAFGTRVRELVEGGAITLLTSFGVHRLTTGPDGVTVSDGTRSVGVDRIVSTTGFRPDHGIVAELRLDLDPILACHPRPGAVDRPERALLRHGPAARRGRVGPAGAWLLRDRRQVLRPRRHFLLASGYEQARSVPPR
jgi:hypothetical protein